MSSIEELFELDLDNNEYDDLFVEDGIWDITAIPRLFLGFGIRDDLGESATLVRAFIQEHGYDNIRIADPYETGSVILLAAMPKKFHGWRGGLNYGACAVLENCPTDLMILAEND